VKIVSVVGARPQFIKAAAVSGLIRQHHTEILVHTGQHYDERMSDVFFDELDMPRPEHNLHVGSGAQGAQTGAMLAGIEDVLLEEKPDWLLVYGDTNSTLAGALAAAKLHVPVAHVEAGLRSFNRRMPEEVNRVVCDHLSALLFCPSDTAARNLKAEGITRGVHTIGDVMVDTLALARRRADTRSRILDHLNIGAGRYVLATVHRAENTDDPQRLARIMAAFNAVDEVVVLPLHPRSRKALAALNVCLSDNVRVIDPVGYLDMVMLAKAARLIATDSGGVQKEAYWLGIPCVTLRDETEWVETVDAGWNVLAGSGTEAISTAIRNFAPPAVRPSLYGVEGAAARCVLLMEQHS
jgi:UDP-GlcNAc3NAcA epimerase